MTGPRATALILLIVVALVGFAAVAKRADYSATGRAPTAVLAATHSVKVADKRAAQQAQPIRRRAGAITRIMHRPVAAGRALCRHILNRRIQATSLRIQASLAQDPDNFDARDRLWQRLHRLQTRRDNLS